MHRFAAALLALTVMQGEPSEAPAAPAPAPEPRGEPPAAPPPAAPAPEPRHPGTETGATAPASAPPPSSPRPAPAAPSAEPVRQAPPRPNGSPPPAPGPRSPPPLPAAPAAASAPPPPSAPPPSVTATPRPPPAAGLGERDQALLAALGFVEALLRGDAPGLAAASAPRFSFDGGIVEGREAQTRRWREIFAARASTGEALRDLVVLRAGEAQAQLGAPPARVAGLLDPEGWVAVADLSGRPVVLFLVRQGNRFAVAGMHD